ncbi:MAG TPA: response regulator, partial [Cellvibrionaceae bacterium]|nr:response regulator [Cellvibrionaceae bacterium]
MTLNILVVEDDRPLAITLMKGLQNAFSENICVDVCFSGLQAFSFINQKTYDLVLSDFQMQGISGLELLHRIRQFQPKAVLILMTAYGTDELERKARQFVDTYLTKPF